MKKAITSFALLAYIGSAAFASEGDTIKTPKTINLNEIVVAASKDQRKHIDLPTAVSIVTAKDLNQQGVVNLKDLSATMPNIYMPNFGSAISSPIYIRGVGSRRSPSVAVYYDGVPLLEEATFDFNLSEVSSVELLRGPQGTLYGRNALGGILNIVSRQPLDRRGLSLLMRTASYEQSQLGADYYGRITPTLGYSAGVNYQHKGGYFTNNYNNKVVDASNAISARAAVEWQGQHGWHLNGFLQYHYLDQGGYPYGLVDKVSGKVQEVNYNEPASYRRGVATLGLHVSKRFDSGLQLRSATSLQHLEDRQHVDQDFTTTPKYVAMQRQNKRILTQEFVATGHAAAGRYGWIAGAFGFYENGSRNTDVDLGPMVQYRHYSEPDAGFALYHQSSYRLIAGLTAEAGVRLDMERIGQTYNVTVRKGDNATQMPTLKTAHTFTQVTPKFSLRYAFSPSNMIYASVLRGYKAGGFNTAFDTEMDRAYQPEYSWNYELGSRIGLWDNRLQAEAAVFYIDWLQQQISQPLASGQGTHITNAGESYSLGAELSLRAKITNDLYLTGSYGYTAAKYRKFIYNDKVDYSGNYTQQVPRQTFALTADYTVRLRSPYIDVLNFAAQYNGIGRLYWNDANSVSQAYYGLLGGKVTATKGRLSLDVWIKNALNAEYKAYFFSTGGQNFAQKGAPMHFGSTLRITL